jgi:hypothetical protein
MNKSQIFKKAHELAKSVHVAGDCYRVTFGAALKIVIAEIKAPKTLADRLLAAGAKVWSTADGKLNRIYINQDIADVVFAELAGFNQAIRVGKAKLFLDVKTGKLFSDKGMIRVCFNATTYATGWACSAA